MCGKAWSPKEVRGLQTIPVYDGICNIIQGSVPAWEVYKKSAVLTTTRSQDWPRFHGTFSTGYSQPTPKRVQFLLLLYNLDI